MRRKKIRRHLAYLCLYPFNAAHPPILYTASLSLLHSYTIKIPRRSTAQGSDTNNPMTTVHPTQPRKTKKPTQDLPSGPQTMTPKAKRYFACPPLCRKAELATGAEESRLDRCLAAHDVISYPRQWTPRESGMAEQCWPRTSGRNDLLHSLRQSARDLPLVAKIGSSSNRAEDCGSYLMEPEAMSRYEDSTGDNHAHP